VIHSDFCPCKHLRFVCCGVCSDCATEQFGGGVATFLVHRDGEAPAAPAGYDEFQRDHRGQHEAARPTR